MTEVKFPFYARLALTLIAVVLIIFLLAIGSSIFIPLFFALLISILLYPLTDFLERKKLGRSASAFISVLLFISFVALFVYFLALQIIGFSQDLPHFQTRLQNLIDSLQYTIESKYHINSSQQTDYLNRAASTLLNTLANSISNIFLSLSKFTIYTIFVFVYTFFMLYNRKLLLRFVLGIFKPTQHDKVMEVVADTRSMINHYILGLLLEMVIMTIFNCGAFFILGIRYAILLGTIAAVMNIIPYIGIYTAMAISMTVTFANSTGSQALTVGIILIVIHFIDANVLLPRIVGARVKMNPLITIIAVLTGAQIWGIAGMFLFIPLTAMLKIIFQRVESLQPWAILIGAEDNL